MISKHIVKNWGKAKKGGGVEIILEGIRLPSPPPRRVATASSFTLQMKFSMILLGYCRVSKTCKFTETTAKNSMPNRKKYSISFFSAAPLVQWSHCFSYLPYYKFRALELRVIL